MEEALRGSEVISVLIQLLKSLDYTMKSSASIMLTRMGLYEDPEIPYQTEDSSDSEDDEEEAEELEVEEVDLDEELHLELEMNELELDVALGFNGL